MKPLLKVPSTNQTKLTIQLFYQTVTKFLHPVAQRKDIKLRTRTIKGTHWRIVYEWLSFVRDVVRVSQPTLEKIQKVCMVSKYLEREARDIFLNKVEDWGIDPEVIVQMHSRRIFWLQTLDGLKVYTKSATSFDIAGCLNLLSSKTTWINFFVRVSPDNIYIV